ncbi:PREDICTED: uncharacterized protein LOC108776232 [Cyphomyrmex costatus]|uniref:uncharacterized protein LOC108776232 n=1 Tax=Cyphomyrmex costatus TaxID=456900 RepID=UPI00085245BF|nr:PREDICTED: uncharacterized protein LOC108776232 [Cyphomyrmex costatus]
MIRSIVTLLLFCQLLNIGKGLWANGTRDENSETAQRFRLRRSLTFPSPESMLLLIFGLGTPLQLDRENVIVGVFTKMIYAMPTNATDFTEPGVYYGKTSRSRWSFYKLFEKITAMYGLGGKECLLKAICEVASAPFDVHHGLLGQLVQTFLRPSSTREEYDEYGDREYRAAERLGELAEGAACHALYPECRRSVLDVFSTLTT